ncbi:MAG: phytanoyl-CoA dioxygenase family protein [Pseudonocardiaceae bacterium]
MPLTFDELTAFKANGLIIKPGFVSSRLVGQASALIDHWYRDHIDRMDHGLVAVYTQRTFAPDLGNHPILLSLFHDSGVAELTRNLLDVIAPVTTTQIQIRIPDTHSGSGQPEKAMHVDGVACPHLDPAELRTFSMLVGVVLSDISDPGGGALRYVPGGHLSMADWFRTQWSLGVTDQVPPQVDAQQGTPFLGQPGDLLLMHHLVPHAVGRNHTTIPRVMAYFRVSHVDHARRRLDALCDPWLDYPPLAELTST